MVQKKRIALLFLLLAAAMLCAACAGKPSEATTTGEVPVVLSQAEYMLYQNVFYNDYGPELEGKETSKQGVFATLHDAFNDRDRYYVWGYLDNTKCCDWQWEIVPKAGAALPPNGSLVSVKGIFAASQEALDGYWIQDAALETVTRYTGDAVELNMCTMSCTLERVQMYNILYLPDAFEGKAFSAYGRIASLTELQDPYYNGSWQIPFTAKDAAPSIGTSVVLRGRVASGTLSDCAVEITN